MLAHNTLGEMPFRDVLNILEGNTVQVPCKGSFLTWRPKVVFFTSDVHPSEWTFTSEEDSRKRVTLDNRQYKQFWRRVTHCERIQPTVNAFEVMAEADEAGSPVEGPGELPGVGEGGLILEAPLPHPPENAGAFSSNMFLPDESDDAILQAMSPLINLDDQ